MAQEVPPCFNDLGKPARDLFSKGYNFGVYKLEVSGRASNGLKMTAQGVHNNDSKQIQGHIETKMNWPKQGLSVTEKWTTSGLLSVEAVHENKAVEGSKLTLLSTYAPDTAKRTALLKAALKKPQMHFTTDVNMDFAGPVINSGVVLSQNAVRFGANVRFNSGKSALEGHQLAMGYLNGPYTIHAGVTDLNAYETAVHYKVDSQLEGAVHAKWLQDNSKPSLLAVAAKYNLDRYTSVRAKIDNNAILGLSYQQNLKPGVTVTWSAMVDTNRFSEGKHNAGFALELNA